MPDEYWFTCSECGEKAVDRKRHAAFHFERPGDDYMTPEEVSAAIGHPVNTIRWWIKSGKLAADRRQRGHHRLWIRKAVMKAFIEERLARNLGTAVAWAQKP